MNRISDALAQYNKLEQSGALDALEGLRRENRELDRIITDAALLVAYTDVTGMLDFVIARILDHFIPSFLAFLVTPPRGDGMRHYCYRNLKVTDEQIPAVYYNLLRTRFGTKPSAVTFAELEEELGADLFDRDFRKLNPRLIFPMFGIGGLYGVVILGEKVMGDDYTELEQKYLDRIIRFLSVSMQNGLHYETSITDSKTGLFTHDYFIRRLEEELSHAARHGPRSGILMLDVDHFKRFNDSWGHVAGDLALVKLAALLRRCTRSEDCVARFGGEEFSVLVAECCDRSLMEVAERIREEASIMDIQYNGQNLRLTVSIGVRSIDGKAGMNPLMLMSEADRALYRSKMSGRNRVTLYSAGLLDRASRLLFLHHAAHHPAHQF